MKKVIREYTMAGDDWRAPGAIVICQIDNEIHPFVVWFRNDQDSEREGRPCYYYGNYCEDFKAAERAYSEKCHRYDPMGRRNEEWRRQAFATAI